jgi:hypothetical protein
MRLVAQVRLLTTREQVEALAATLVACNRAAEWVSTVAWEQWRLTQVRPAWPHLWAGQGRVRVERAAGPARHQEGG